MRIPRATYRLQFHEHFQLTDAVTLVPYLHDLGVSHVYASPLFKATPHSTHGYDVCDFNQLNPEVGTEADLERLAKVLHRRNMGLILDIVPNHMGIGSPENTWWWDVLARGEKSPFAVHFDIDWKLADKILRGKVLVPVLGAPYEAILKQGQLRLLFENGSFVLGYHEHRFPIAPETAAKLSSTPAGLEAFNSNVAALDKLIRQQHYRLVFHEQGDAQINYRRFFAVSSLAAVRVENDETFAATHALLRRWLEAGLLDGLRVDHPDGLRVPGAYLHRLRALAPEAWIVTEKILEGEESLPAAWPVQGTTGYDFLNWVNGIFVDTDAERAFTDFYAAFTGQASDYPAMLLAKKRAVLKTLLAAEWNRLTGLLAGVASKSARMKSFSRAELQQALAEVIACFPVYRTYVHGTAAVDPEDTAVIKSAVHLACENRKDLPPEIFAFIHALLLKPQSGAATQNFVARFQQLTGAVMAKGAEDTAFYCFNRFVSLNEVGGNPGRFGGGVHDFHELLQRQAAAWPYSQLTTSTHDTKRAEDVRARLNVLSEIPDEWAQAVRHWSELTARHRQEDFPDRNAEYLFYQTLVGAWPLAEERAQAYMEKATHEAKEHTDWTKRSEPYENALRDFISATLKDAEFTADLERFVSRISEAAAVNSLGQTLIKLTAPGVPDIYQGCELWDFSLVDPDNRRPVDFAIRQRLLETTTALPAEAAWNRWGEGVAKLWLIQKALKLRAQIPEFQDLSYEPEFAQGPKKDHVVAFRRGGLVMPVAPRLFLKLNQDWQDTALELPEGNWRDEFSGDMFRGVMRLEHLLRKFPVALLVKKERD
jgi:(1->4)-alpha-D-glucan 1-alpha-D-glucosylmutase